jgi:hypothetical protein
VDDDIALSALRQYYGRSGGADPVRGWQLLSSSGREYSPWDTFKAGWDDVYAAETVGVATGVPETLNVFDARVRIYREDGWVEERDVRVRLVYEDGEVYVQREIRSVRPRGFEPHHVTYPKARLEATAPTYVEPDADSTVAAPAAYLTKGGRLVVLCTLPGAGPAQTWVRTEVGWIDRGHLGAFDAHAPACDPGYAR